MSQLVADAQVMKEVRGFGYNDADGRIKGYITDRLKTVLKCLDYFLTPYSCPLQAGFPINSSNFIP